MKMVRKSCKDNWNAFMYEGADFSKSINDIPYCPTTAENIPRNIITWNEAVTLYNKEMKKDKSFFCDAFVCWYKDDYKFDGKGGIWHRYDYVLKVLKHFSGAITPDFSTFQDFPEPLKIYNTSRMRVFGYWLSENGIKVINNVRWGTAETYRYCFDGLPVNSIIAIGTVGGSPKKIVDRYRFEQGLYILVDLLTPHTIIVYGSANYPCFEYLKSKGITIVSFQSETSMAYSKGANHE